MDLRGHRRERLLCRLRLGRPEERARLERSDDVIEGLLHVVGEEELVDLFWVDHAWCVCTCFACRGGCEGEDIGIGIGMWGAAALSLTSDVPLATGNGGPRGLCHRKPDGRHTGSASRSWEMGG